MTIMVAVATLIGTGGSAFAALKLGKKEEEAQRTLNNVLILCFIASALVGNAGLVF